MTAMPFRNVFEIVLEFSRRYFGACLTNLKIASMLILGGEILIEPGNIC
jgi:hypothetical protein